METKFELKKTEQFGYWEVWKNGVVVLSPTDEKLGQKYIEEEKEKITKTLFTQWKSNQIAYEKIGEAIADASNDPFKINDDIPDDIEAEEAEMVVQDMTLGQLRDREADIEEERERLETELLKLGYKIEMVMDEEKGCIYDLIEYK
jgi:hypothetical protein